MNALKIEHLVADSGGVHIAVKMTVMAFTPINSEQRKNSCR